MLQQFDSLLELTEAFPDEQSCIDHLRAIRWKSGPFCPYCGSAKVYHFSDKRTHKCGDCRQRFSIKVGTIFEDSKLPLRKWYIAVWMLTSHKKGISSVQLAKDLKITQKSAWFMAHRLRFAARTKSFNRPLKGEVEVDETFLGGKEKNKPLSKRANKGRGPANKTIVMGMLERGGELRAMKVASTKADHLQAKLFTHVEPGSTVMSDEHTGYLGIDRMYHHETVEHRGHKWVRGNVHTNSIEGAWGLFKRQVYGIHHWISEKHTNQYVSEFTWRYNRRNEEEGERVNQLLDQVGGRLKYKDLIA